MHSLDIVNRQTNKKIHDDYRLKGSFVKTVNRQLFECYHDQDKEEKKESCGALVRNHHHSIVVLGVVKEKIVVLHFPAGHDQGLDQGQVEGLEVRLVVEQNKKSKGKGNNEENNDGRNFQKSVAHVNEHHHVDSEERNFSENELEILEIEKKNWNRVKDLKSFIIKSLGRVYWPDEREKVEPGDGYSHRPQPPLPAQPQPRVLAAGGEVEHHEDGRDVAEQVNDVVHL